MKEYKFIINGDSMPSFIGTYHEALQKLSKHVARLINEDGKITISRRMTSGKGEYPKIRITINGGLK